MASTRRGLSQREELGHIRGNFQVVIDTLQKRILELGGSILTDTAIEGFVFSSGRVSGVSYHSLQRSHEVVISTVPEPYYRKFLPKEMREQNPLDVPYMGIVCILLVLNKQLTPFYTLNLVDETIPYTAIIETTNVIDTELMNGKHLVYIPKYVSPVNRQWFARSDEEIRAECFGYLKRMFDDFSETCVDAVLVNREAFVEPLYTLNFGKTIPSFEGPLKGLFVANNSQTYPFLLNCESVVALAKRVVDRVYDFLRNV
jgi:protoporphyrinogen oxidase